MCLYMIYHHIFTNYNFFKKKFPNYNLLYNKLWHKMIYFYVFLERNRKHFHKIRQDRKTFALDWERVH